MKIYFDNIIFGLQKAGGISVYWQEIIKRIKKEENFNVKFIERDNYKENIFRKEIKLQNKIIDKGNIKLKRYIPIKIEERDKFIFHSSYYRYCNSKNAINVVTVHDFTYEYFVSGIAKTVHYHQKRKALKKADYIICVSENTKNDLLKIHPWCKSKKIYVIHNGVSEEYCRIDEKVQSDYRSLIYVGGRAGYKNFKIMIQIMKELDINYKLIIIGGGHLTKDEIRELEKEIKGRYIKLDKISNLELNKLYNQAEALIYPSEYEGFGIPVIEAMKSGCPVLAYNASSIPEVVGSKYNLIKNNSVQEYIDELKKLNDKDYRKSVIELGVERSKKYSWNKAYSETKKVYLEILGGMYE